jgi:DNA-binding cell septation regulator SpoVG
MNVVIPITEVTISVAPPGGATLGYASVVLADAIAVHGLRVKQNAHGGRYVASPRVPLRRQPCDCGHRAERAVEFCGGCGARLAPAPADQATHRDSAHPVHEDQRRCLAAAVLDAFDAVHAAGHGPGEPIRVRSHVPAHLWPPPVRPIAENLGVGSITPCDV